MISIMFMPWCQLEDVCKVGDITILPFKRQKRLTEIADADWIKICEVLASYRDIKGDNVNDAAIVQISGKKVIDAWDPDKINSAAELISIACFSAIAKRKYFYFCESDYCNSDCFTLVLQKLESNSDGTALTLRRRDGCSISSQSMQKISISVPVHCHTAKNISDESALSEALVSHRKKLLVKGTWGRWNNAIACFNQANTDSDNIRDNVEWVLLSSAFEHLLEAKSKSHKVARKFCEVLCPPNNILAKDSLRFSDDKPRISDDEPKTLRYEWMREFYRIRGDFAHGKLVPQQPMKWTVQEHLLLATIAFPLVIKSLLVKASKYILTNDDEAQVACFEGLANTLNFLEAPPCPKENRNSHWMQLLDEYNEKKRREDTKNKIQKAIAEQEDYP